MRRIALLLAVASVGGVGALPAYCGTAATSNTATSFAPFGEGQPQLGSGRPQTLWNKQDVAAYRASLVSDKALAAAFEKLRAWGDTRITEPLDVPVHQLESDGTWNFTDFKRGYQDASGKWIWEWDFNGALQKRAADVSNLGMLYALTGDKKYAAFAGRLLAALADAYGEGKGKPDQNGYDHFAAYGFDGGDVGMFLAKICQGYDLIYNSPLLSASERGRIERDLIRPLAESLKKSTFMYTSHGRWGMVCLYGLFIAGETLDDPSLTNLALYGPGGSEDKVTGGFMDCFKSGCLRDGVIWGADTKIDDQMASVSVLIAVAEVMRHRGVNLYDLQDGALKKPFDAALDAVGNDDNATLRALPGIDAFRYAYRRYKDPRYLSVINKLEPAFTLAIGEHLPSPPASQ